MCQIPDSMAKESQILKNGDTLLPRSPAAERNKQPILDVLREVLPTTGRVLEIASGTGQHVSPFARAMPGLIWQPSDPDPDYRATLLRRGRLEGLKNVLEPIALDVRGTPWPVAAADAVVCINMIHIAPWEATLALILGARNVLPADGVLFLYGPYRREGRHTGPGNVAFDADLRSRNPAWGIRDLESVERLAIDAGFSLDRIVAMPADNLSVVFRLAQG